MKKTIFALAVLVLALLAARVALADARYTDPGGDSGGAPDITTVSVAHDTAGNLTITVATDQPSLLDQNFLTIYLDTDGNQSTGGDGVEYHLLWGNTGGIFYRWNGTRFVEATGPTISTSYANGLLTFKVERSDIGVTDSFTFYVVSQRYNTNGAIIASDHAPNGNGVYDYTLSAPQPLTLRAAAPVAVPARPAAGKAFAVRVAVTRGDTGTALTSGVATCKVTVGLKPLRAIGSVRAGRATCAMVLPKTARGKRIRGTIKVTFRTVSVSRAFSYRVP